VTDIELVKNLHLLKLPVHPQISLLIYETQSLLSPREVAAVIFDCLTSDSLELFYPGIGEECRNLLEVK
jgi:hypothetical protein